MHNLHSFKDVRRILGQFVPPARDFRAKYTLATMHALMDMLGNPQNTYKVIHIAGTSGKTSTSYYIASLLQQTRVKVGLTVSPYVDEVNERLQIDLVPMPEAEFCKELSEFLEIVEKTRIKPTYFELLIAFAYWEFARQDVDYAVVEVGLGGLLDGTNVVDNPDKVCVITDIGLDHTNVLGKTLPDIAAQKAGIITDHNAVFCYRQRSGVMKAIKTRCATQHAQLYEVTPPDTSTLPGELPLFQRHNWYLARIVTEYLVQRDQLLSLTTQQLKQSIRTYIPARMEIIKIGGKTIILDGAHNPQKLHALVQSLQAKFPGKKMVVLMALLSGKDLNLDDIAKEIQPVVASLITTSFAAQQDMPRGSIDPKELMKAAKTSGVKAEVVEDPKEAFNSIMKSKEPIILVTGSFYLLNHIRPLIFVDNQ